MVTIGMKKGNGKSRHHPQNTDWRSGCSPALPYPPNGQKQD